jgi:hypothetical protein
MEMKRMSDELTGSRLSCGVRRMSRALPGQTV